MYLIELQGSSHLYQWDVDRYIIIQGTGIDTIPTQIDFVLGAEGDLENAYSMPVFEYDLQRYQGIAQIPDELLKQSGNLFIYLRNSEDTINLGQVEIISAPQPQDYSPAKSNIINLANLEHKISALYVTPEMFKSEEDVDDTNSIQRALDTGKPVYFQRKTYFCSAPLITKKLYNIYLKGGFNDTEPIAESELNNSVPKTILKFVCNNVSEKNIYFITDDDKKSTSYLKGGNVFLEDIEFQGTASPKFFDSTESFGGGLCYFFSRDSLTVRNCNFKNHYTNGLVLSGLRNQATVENSVFENLGRMLVNGSRNAISVDRLYWDRGENKMIDEVSQPLTVKVNNCIFNIIGDECVCTTGIENATVSNCTMNNIGHYVLETGHRADKFSFCHTISNCVGDTIGAGLYSAGADGWHEEAPMIYPYEGNVNILGCHFKNLATAAKDVDLMGNIRHPISVICAAHLVDKDAEAIYQPTVYIKDSYINGGDGSANLEETSFISGGSIYLINSRISFGSLHTVNIFNFDKKMIIQDCNVYLSGRNRHADGYFWLKEKSQLTCKDSLISVHLGSSSVAQPMIRVQGPDVSISFDNCTLSNLSSWSYSFIKIDKTNFDNCSISFINNTMQTVFGGYFINVKDSEGAIKALKFMENYFANTISGEKILSNLTKDKIKWYICKNNNRYNNSVYKEGGN